MSSKLERIIEASCVSHNQSLSDEGFRPLDSGPVYPERYTNFGWFDYFYHPEDVDFFRIPLDTWYYAESDDIGRMALPHEPITDKSLVNQYLLDQLILLADAFAPLFRVRGILRVGSPGPAGSTRYENLHLEAHEMPTTIQHLRDTDPERPYSVANAANLDGYLMLHDAAGTYQRRVVRSVGRVLLYPNRGIQGKYAGLSQFATLSLNILALFRPDNSQVLEALRSRWKMLQATDPQITVDSEESTGIAFLVTLVDPPAGTPPGNGDLYERHWPRLLEAIRRWEEREGSTFQWAQSVFNS
jgi:hypothetical protein